MQRCTFHAYCRIRQATTTRPKLEASRSLYALGRQLTHVHDSEGAQEWIGAYQDWCTRWKGFLEEKTRRPEGGRVQLSVYPSFCLKGLMHDE